MLWVSIPILLFISGILGGYGVRILWVIKSSLSAGNQRVTEAFREVTIMMIISVVSFVVLAIVLGLDTILTGDDVALSMIPSWIQEVAGFLAATSVLRSLVVHQPSSTKKSTSSKDGGESDSHPNPNLEKARLELQSGPPSTDELI